MKVEVHNSSSGSSCDDSRASVTEEDPIKEPDLPNSEPDYEDIHYPVHPDETGHDSGKHSRCPSVSSTNSNVIVHDPSTLSPESGMSSASPSDLGQSEEENEKTKTQIDHTQSLPHPANNSRILKRVPSEPGGVGAPPPPPPLPSADEDSTPTSSLPPPSPPLSRHESSLQSLQRSPSTLSGNTETSTVEQCSDIAPGGGTPGVVGVQPANLIRQKVLPFIPPKFTGHDPDALIKPSEYLRSISSSSTGSSGTPVVTGTGSNPPGTVVPGSEMGCPPPPPPPPVPAPPPPPPPASAAPAAHDQPKHSQPLSTISIDDLKGVKLRHTKQPACKTMSCPPRPCLSVGNQPFQAQKEDLIAELKLSRDIPGIKKLKNERVKNEEKHEKEMVTELSRQYSMEHFVDKMPEKDSAGNPIPPWKRQMLAKKAAEKARKEMEQQLAKEAEEKRLQSIPAWKRHLMQAKKTDDTPPPTRPASVQHQAPMPPPEEKKVVDTKNTGEAPENKENNKPEPVKSETKPNISNNNSDDDNAQIIPWRAHLRKTNSTLNLLE